MLRAECLRFGTGEIARVQGAEDVRFAGVESPSGRPE
jgi:hypothetical protein